MSLTTEKDCAVRRPPMERRLKEEHADALYERIMEKLQGEKLFRHAHYTAAQLAKELGVDKRRISLCIRQKTGEGYNTLVNRLRLKMVCRLLRSKRHDHLPVEEVGMLAGFASRQAFYLAFGKAMDCTPLHYRKQRGATTEKG